MKTRPPNLEILRFDILYYFLPSVFRLGVIVHTVLYNKMFVFHHNTNTVNSSGCYTALRFNGVRDNIKHTQIGVSNDKS